MEQDHRQILVVDDDQIQREWLRRALGKHYLLTDVETGAEMLYLLGHSRFDLILLDYRLPDYTGIELLPTLARGAAPVVMMTGAGHEAVAVEAMKLGCVDYLVKRDTSAEDVRKVVDRGLAQGRLLGLLERRRRDLDLFTTSIAHDLRAPMRTLRGFLKLLDDHADDGELSPDVEDLVRNLGRVSLRMERQFDGLLEYASAAATADAEESAVVDLGHVLQTVRHQLAEVLRQRSVVLEIGTLPRVMGSVTGLQKVLRNLIGNAVKYCEAAPRIEIGAEPRGEQWVISVTDNGIGIAPEQRQKIFEPFARLHGTAEYEGVGLGLAICRRVIERCGGQIWVDDGAGGGSTFRFSLFSAETHAASA